MSFLLEGKSYYCGLFEELTPLPDDEKIKDGYLIEDLSTGARERVDRNGFYSFARTQRVGSVKQLPQVIGVVRPEFVWRRLG